MLSPDGMNLNNLKSGTDYYKTGETFLFDVLPSQITTANGLLDRVDTDHNIRTQRLTRQRHISFKLEAWNSQCATNVTSIARDTVVIFILFYLFIYFFFFLFIIIIILCECVYVCVWWWVGGGGVGVVGWWGWWGVGGGVGGWWGGRGCGGGCGGCGGGGVGCGGWGGVCGGGGGGGGGSAVFNNWFKTLSPKRQFSTLVIFIVIDLKTEVNLHLFDIYQIVLHYIRPE